MDEQLTEQVSHRAGGLCEYCHFPEAYSETTFEVDHIIAKQHGGKTLRSNLAWCCLRCNLYKGPNISGIDPQGPPGTPVRLFHPRRHKWSTHFRWAGASLIGKTAIGRATIQTLNINHPDRIKLREALMEDEVFP